MNNLYFKNRLVDKQSLIVWQPFPLTCESASSESGTPLRTVYTQVRFCSSPPIDVISALTIDWRTREKIIGTVQ